MKHPCPPTSELESFLRGDVCDEKAADIEAHLLDCVECGHRADQCATNDTVVEELLRHSETWSDQQDPLVQQITNHMRDLPICLANRSENGYRVVDSSLSDDGIPPAIYRFFETPRDGGGIGCFGKYRVIGLLGTGAMGVVLDAVDTVLQRPVALKLLLPTRWSVDGKAEARLRREAMSVANLRHANIVMLYDQGEIDGVPFLAFERLAGETLQARLDRDDQIPVATALQITEQVLRALSVAHANGLIHRDIKPSNIWLVSRQSPESHAMAEEFVAHVKLLDFGLARPLTVTSPPLTLDGAMIGTPGYWAFEQASGKAVDERSDLFGVGCVLYRMLTGKLPFVGSDFFEYLTALASRTPAPPSHHIATITPAIDQIVLRLLARDPASRYQSAADCLKNLERLRLTPAAVNDHSISAANARTQPSPLRRRWHPRSWSLAAAAAILLFALAIIRVVTNYGTVVITSQSNEVEVEIRGSHAEPQIVLVDRQSEIDLTLTPGEYELSARDRHGLEFFATKPIRVVRGGKELVRVDYLRSEAKGQKVDESEPIGNRSGRPVSQEPVELLRTTSIGGDYLRHWTSILSLAIDTTKQQAVTGSLDGRVRLWDLTNRARLCELDAHATPVVAVAIHPQLVQLVTGGDDGLVKFWEPRSTSTLDFHLQRTLVLNHPVGALQFSDDGTTLAVATRETLQTYDTSTMKLLSDLRYEAADLGIGRGVAFFHHSPRLAYRAGNHVVVIDSRSGQELSRFDLGEARLTALAVSSNDQQIAAGCEAALSSVVVMESATGQVQQRFSSSHVDDLPLQVQFSPSDDRVLAVFGRSPDGTESDPYNSSCVRQWWLDDGEELPIIKSPVYNLGLVDAAYINRGEQIVVTVRNVAGTLWDSHTGGRVEQEEFAPFHTAALHVGADLIAAGAIDGRVHLFSLTTRMKRSTILAHESQVFDMAFSTDGNRLLTSGTDGTVRMWNVATGESLWVTSQWSPGVYWVAGDEYVVAGGKWFEQPPQLISATNGEFCPQPESWTTRPVVSVAASFNSLVATGHVTEPVKLWDLQTMQVVGEFVETPLSSYVGANAVAFNAESTLLAVSYDGTENQRSHIVLWDVAKRRPLASQDRVFGRILTMGFTPSGRLLATGSWGDSTLVLWDVPSLRPLGKLQVGPPRSGVLWLAFFDEGNQLVVLGSDGRLQFVQLSPSAPGEDKLSP